MIKLRICSQILSSWCKIYQSRTVFLLLLTSKSQSQLHLDSIMTSQASSSKVCNPVEGGNHLVKSLVEKAHSKYDINYQGYLANHLSHALYTLYSLGASKSRIQEYYNIYVQKLEPLRTPRFSIDTSNWMEHIGKEDAYSSFLHFFDGEVTTKGLKGTLDLYYSQLMGHSLGAALHPLIHIGYAMEYLNPLLLSEGLAYACSEPLKNTSAIVNNIDATAGGGDGEGAGATIVSLIEELHTAKGKEFPVLSDDIGHFGHKTQYLLNHYGEIFKTLISKWDLSDDSSLPSKLNELTEASILAVFAPYEKQIDFFLLHGVTGNHGVRQIFPHLNTEMQRHILRVNLLGLLTDYVVQRRPKVDVGFVTGYKSHLLDDDEATSWATVTEKAMKVEEEHVLKVVRSLLHYCENVPSEERSELFSEDFIKRCAFKAVDILNDINDYVF